MKPTYLTLVFAWAILLFTGCQKTDSEPSTNNYFDIDGQNHSIEKAAFVKLEDNPVLNDMKVLLFISEGLSFDTDSNRELKIKGRGTLMELGSEMRFENIPLYDVNGKTISKNDPLLMDKKTFEEFMSMLYIDQENKPKAMVLIPMTEEQKEMNKQLAMSSKKLEQVEKEYVGQKAPSFSLNDLSRVNFSNENLKGKTVVINFWFIKCKPCIQEMPSLNRIVKKYRDRKDIVFLSVTFDKAKELTEFIKKINSITNILQEKGAVKR